MQNVVDLNTRIKNGRRRLGRLAILFGAPLALLIYFLLLEQYGLSFLDLDDDERVAEERVLEAVP